jgi:adenylylsulfate kinase-like enzyme
MTRRNVFPAQKIQQDSSIAIYHTLSNYSACHSRLKHRLSVQQKIEVFRISKIKLKTIMRDPSSMYS